MENDNPVPGNESAHDARPAGDVKASEHTPGYEVLRLDPGGVEIALGPAEGCDTAAIAADQSRCDKLVAAALAERAALQRQYISLRRDVYQSDLRVAAYEAKLASFGSQLAAFEQALADYVANLAGRSYTTSALADEALALDQLRSALSGVRSNILQTYDDLTKAVDAEKARTSDLIDAIGRLIDELAAQLKTFLCKDCARLRPLLEQLRRLRRDVNNIMPRSPSGQPATIPWVPTLPPPPWSGSSWIPRGSGSAAHASVRVLMTGTPALTDVPRLIYAGQVFPTRIPLEGAPRVCLGQVWWFHRMKFVDPGHLLKQVDEGTRGPSAQFLFRREPPPMVEVEGGLDASDVYVSQDRTRVYFTLYRDGQPSSVDKANVTITDASGTVVKLHSTNPDDDPSPFLRFESDIEVGLAGLLGSLAYVAVDAFFDSLRYASAPPPGDFTQAFRRANDIFLDISARLLTRNGAQPTTSELEAWAKPHWPSAFPSDFPALPMFGELQPSGGALRNLWNDVPAWYDVLSTAQTRTRFTTGLFSDYPNMVLNRMDEWDDELNWP